MDKSLEVWRDTNQIDEHAYGQLLILLSKFGVIDLHFATNQGHLGSRSLTIEGSHMSHDDLSLGDCSLDDSVLNGYCSQHFNVHAFAAGFSSNILDPNYVEINRDSINSSTIYHHNSTLASRNIIAYDPSYNSFAFEAGVGEAFNNGTNARGPFSRSRSDAEYEMGCIRCCKHKKRVRFADTLYPPLELIVSQCTSTQSGACEYCSKADIPPQLCIRVRFADEPVFSKCTRASTRV